MKFSKKLLLGLTVYAICASNFANAIPEQSITYKNQHGSMMTLTWHLEANNTGTLTGSFTTAVGNCKTDIGKPMPLVGYFNGNAVAITVNFPNCKQVVAMTGHVTDKNKDLTTLWLDTTQSKDPMHKDWDANVTGADYYKKVG